MGFKFNYRQENLILLEKALKNDFLLKLLFLQVLRADTIKKA